MPVRIYHNLIRYKDSVLTEYKVRGTAINDAEFEPPYDGNEYVTELNRSCDYYFSTEVIEGETVKVYYYYDWDADKNRYWYIQGGAAVEYFPPKPTKVNGITFSVKYKTDGVVDSDFTSISCDISPEGNWEFTYPLNKRIYSLDEFRNEADYSFTEYGIINDGTATLLTVDLSLADNLSELTSMDNAFKGCYRLQGITFGSTSLSSLTSADDAFFDSNLIPSAINKVYTAPNLVGDVGESSFFSGHVHYNTVTVNNTNVLRVDGFDPILDDAALSIPSSINVKSGTTLTVAQMRATPDVGRAVFYRADLTSIVIPSDITKIGILAFVRSDIVSVTLPNTLVRIEDCAFAYCSSLTSISIPNSVTDIGEGTFWGCSSLTSVTLSNNITKLGSYDFDKSGYTDPEWLDERSYINESQYVELLGQTECWCGVFSECDSLSSIVIPNSVTVIGDSCFEICSNLASVTMSNAVTHIGTYAFSSCRSLTSVALPNTLTHIGDFVFWNSTVEFQTLYVPTALQHVGEMAFAYCTVGDVVFQSIEHMCRIEYCGNYSSEIAGGSTDVYAISLSKIYLENRNITEVTVPSTLTSIIGVFDGCDSLETINIPSSITNVGVHTFSRCTGLTKAVFASLDDLAKIDFSYYNYLPNHDYYIREVANPLFYSHHLYVGANEVTAVTGLSNTITAIKPTTFINCSYITSFTLPSTVTRIEEAAFYGCTGLTEITIPSSVTFIAVGAFWGCSGLRVVRIPSSVTTIERQAFSNSNITFYCEAQSEPAGWSENYYINSVSNPHFTNWRNNKGTVLYGQTW